MSSSLRSAITEEHPKKLVIPCFRVLCSPRGLEEEGFEGKKYGEGRLGTPTFFVDTMKEFGAIAGGHLPETLVSPAG